MKIDPIDIGSYYFPVNVSLFKNLEGKMLTHVEAMNLPEGAEKANKDLVRQTLWGWFSSVQENSLTSYKGCIGPIRETLGVPAEDKYVWITDIGRILTIEESERGFLKPDMSTATTQLVQ